MINLIKNKNHMVEKRSGQFEVYQPKKHYEEQLFIRVSSQASIATH